MAGSLQVVMHKNAKMSLVCGWQRVWKPWSTELHKSPVVIYQYHVFIPRITVWSAIKSKPFIKYLESRKHFIGYLIKQFWYDVDKGWCQTILVPKKVRISLPCLYYHCTIVWHSRFVKATIPRFLRWFLYCTILSLGAII